MKYTQLLFASAFSLFLIASTPSQAAVNSNSKEEIIIAKSKCTQIIQESEEPSADLLARVLSCELEEAGDFAAAGGLTFAEASADPQFIPSGDIARSSFNPGAPGGSGGPGGVGPGGGGPGVTPFPFDTQKTDFFRHRRP